jgi:hypothetical protein
MSSALIDVAEILQMMKSYSLMDSPMKMVGSNGRIELPSQCDILGYISHCFQSSSDVEFAYFITLVSLKKKLAENV